MRTINNRGTEVPSPPGPDDFRNRDLEQPPASLHIGNEHLAIMGRSEFCGSDRTHVVAWVQGEPGSTAAFVESLTQSYGGRLSAAVARELNLDAASTRPVAAHRVRQALSYADTGHRALEGVDFLTLLTHSAVNAGPAFREVANALGLPPSILSSEVRTRIDARMRELVAVAAAHEGSPVDPARVKAMLQKELKLLTN